MKKRIIGFANQKGGVSKTTSTINIAGILGQMGKKVLIIDLDPQSNSSVGLGIVDYIDALDEHITIYECIMKKYSLVEAIMQTEYKNVHIVPAGLKLANAEQELISMLSRESQLKRVIKSDLDKVDYDFILIDLPPNLGLLNTNGLVAAKEIIIPVDSVFAVSGIRQLTNFIKSIKEELNPTLEITGVLIANVDNRTNIAKEVASEITNYFGDKVFENVVRHNIKIQEAQAASMPITYYAPKSIGAEDYIEVAKEVIARGEN